MDDSSLKQKAALAALPEVQAGMRLGLGTGSTVRFFIEALGERVRNGLSLEGCVATSRQSEALAEAQGIRVLALSELPELDLTVDGADEIDPELRLIKGGGAALLREKIVASASRRMVVIADASKQVACLGAFRLPVEVIPFGAVTVARQIIELGGKPELRLATDGKPVTTDEHHHILDVDFGWIREPETLAASLSALAGVVEHGLFLGLAREALIASPDGVLRLTAPPKADASH